MQKFFLSLCFVLPVVSFSQSQPAVIDSFKNQLARAATIDEKILYTSLLAKTLMNINPAEADEYGKQLLQIAETSRQRDKIINALLVNGERFTYLAGRKDNIDKAISYYNQALTLARQNKIDTLIIKSYLFLSEVTRYIPDYAKALDYCNQANSYAVLLKKDSITARVHLEYGLVYLAKGEKLLALRSFLSAIRMAEEIKNNVLQRAGYIRLSSFYSYIEDYDRAIDYQTKALDLLALSTSSQAPYSRVQELNQIGDLYGYKKNADMAFFYYEKALALADSLKFDPIKAMIYRSIVGNYLNNNEPQKALDYFNSHPQLMDFLKNVNFSHFADQSYGFIYAQLEKYDSALYYYNRVAAFFEKDVNVSNKYSYYYQLGILYKKKGDIDKALDYFLKAKELSDQIGNLELMSYTASNLDSLYRKKGDYKQAMLYLSLHNTFKDSLNKLGKEKDLMQIEAADEQQRQERILKEKEEEKRRRNNIQYMIITIGIVFLFVALVVLGMFKVSTATIKMLGFFAFLMFFEFIFLLFKKNIHTITHGEPWKDLLFMIGLAALLLPLHHWLEHKVIHYLTSHNRLTSAGTQLKNRLVKKRNTENG